MFAKGQTVIQYMEQLAPKHLAEDWDKIGLQLGTLQKEITNVLVALDVNDEVVEEAIRLGCNLIIAHHAIIFRPLQGIQTDTPAGKMYEKLIKNDIAVYISHTNLDVTEGGMNDWMAEALGIENGVPIKDIHSEQLSKLVVFVPKDHHQKVLDAILNAGAGAIGNYSHCSFNIEGYGTFIPGEGTDPYIGEKGKMERAEEIRIETIVPHSIRNKVVQAMLTPILMKRLPMIYIQWILRAQLRTWEGRKAQRAYNPWTIRGDGKKRSEGRPCTGCW